MKPKKDIKSTDIDSSAAGNHPVGIGIGAAGGAIGGMVLGAEFGPLGAVTGGVLGAASGALAGRAIAGAVDPTADDYWEHAHRYRPDDGSGFTYGDFAAAYRLGREAHVPGMAFEQAEEDLRKRWDVEKGNPRLPWEVAREAAKASWTRMETTTRARSAGI